MTWADKLLEKIKSRKISVSGLNPFSKADIDITPDPFLKNLTSAVLEKNKEIEKKLTGTLPDVVKHKNSYFLATTLAEARAFREFVEASKKVRK